MIARIFLVVVILLGIPGPVFAITDSELDARSGTNSEAATLTCKTDSTRCFCDLGNEQHVITEKSICQRQCASEGAQRWDLSCISMAETGMRIGGGSTTTTEKAPIQIEITKSSTALQEPNLLVDIPGVDFGDAIGYDENGDLRVNYLGVYIVAVYRFMIPVLTIVAVVMLMVSGMQYMLARGNAEQIKKAKHRMSNAIIGLVILLAAFNITYIVNPDFTRFEPLTLKRIDREEISQSEENPDNQDPGATTAVATVEGVVTAVTSGHLTVNTDEPYINQEVYTHLIEASNDYYNKHKKGLILTSASRTLEKQAKLFYNLCLQYGYCPKAVACDPTGSSRNVSSVVTKTGKNYALAGALAGVDITNSSAIIAQLASNGKVQYCPHTTNVGVDVWPDGHQSGYVNNVADMDALAQIMVDNGFCRLNSESWHFELETKKTSTTNCVVTNTTSKYSYGPQLGCNTWDYDDHCCVLPTNPTANNSALTMCK